MARKSKDADTKMKAKNGENLSSQFFVIVLPLSYTLHINIFFVELYALSFKIALKCIQRWKPCSVGL